MTTKQIKFLSELFQCSSIGEAIEKAGVSRSTAYRWIRDDKNFKNEYQKGNYMDMKLLCDAHSDHFTSVEGITEDLDELEEVLTRYFDNYYAGTDPELNIPIQNTGLSSYAEGGYMARLLQQGDWINRIDSLTDDFVQTYAVQEGN